MTLFKKIIGFLLGFGAAFGLLVLFSIETGFMPRGAGWLFLMVLVGICGASLAADPGKYWSAIAGFFSKVLRSWWLLSPRLRLLIVVSAIWMIASYIIQEEYEEDLKLVFMPPLALIAFHFAERLLVRGKE